ncbi:MAG: glycosyltransferase [Proteobacteria bacterium]|nr:glycosyltransferase [Pseudomonadota bacterium]
MRHHHRSVHHPESDDAEQLDLSVVIPAFQEGRKIGRDIRAADAFLRARGLRGEIIVVDDGSADDTAERARHLQDEVANLFVMSYSPNRGKGYAVRRGVERARGDIVMFADAGLCVPYDAALQGLALLWLDMCDVAHGSRRARGGARRAQPLLQRVGSQIHRWLVHLIMGVPLRISDTQCGFKLYKREVARRLYGEVITDGFMFDVEAIMRALQHNLRILEFPVPFSNDTDTRFHPLWGTVRNITELARIRRAVSQGAPRSRAGAR